MRAKLLLIGFYLPCCVRTGMQIGNSLPAVRVYPSARGEKQRRQLLFLQPPGNSLLEGAIRDREEILRRFRAP